MCVIIVKEQKIEKPDRFTIEDCWYANKDLAGVAYVNPRSKVVTCYRGLLLHELLEINETKIHKEAQAVYHFRIATSGNVNIRNAHPFPLFAKKNLYKTFCDLAIAHNGILNGGDKKLSDTAQLVNWFEREHITDIDYILSLLADGFNKFATIDNHGDITMYGKFQERRGLWFSNLNWEMVYYYPYKNKTQKWEVLVNDPIYDSTTAASTALPLPKPLQCEICYRETKDLIFSNGIYLCNDCQKYDEY